MGYLLPQVIKSVRRDGVIRESELKRLLRVSLSKLRSAAWLSESMISGEGADRRERGLVCVMIENEKREIRCEDIEYLNECIHFKNQAAKESMGIAL
jgi:hypothetical protein